MFKDDYENPDDNQGGGGGSSGDSGGGGGGGADDAKAKRKKDIVDGIIIPYYQQRAGRMPTQSEIDSDYEHYEKYGGDSFRRTIDARFPTSKPPSATGGGDWFSQNGPAAPADYTAGTYTPPTFNEPFVAPTAESLLTDPGYIAGRDATQQGLERSAAAKGSVLSGGFVGKTLPRALTEYAGTAYQNAFGRAFDTYQQKYGMFSDAAARSADAFKTNETGKLNQYTTRYNAYRDIVNQRRQAELDRWNREMDLARLGQGSTGAPPSA